MAGKSSVVIDGTSISLRGKGVSRYVLNLIRHLAALEHEYDYAIFLDANQPLPELPRTINLKYFPVRSRPSLPWRLMALPLLARQLGVQVLHAPTDIMPVWKPARTVVTITEIPRLRYALNPARSHYEHISQKLNELLFPLSLRYADRLIAISDTTRRDLVSMYGTSAESIDAIPLGVEPRFANMFSQDDLVVTRQRFGAAQGYVLCFATDDGRENVKMVIDAWKGVLKTPHCGHKLLLAGCPDAAQMRWRDLAVANGIQDSIVFTGYVDDDLMPLLYSAAEIYVDVSFYEGFGLQSLEAMACGVPVIVSDAAAIVEVVGEAGVIVGSTDQKGLQDAISRVLGDKSLRRDLVGRGLQRANLFSWQKAAQQTADVYRRVLAEMA